MNRKEPNPAGPEALLRQVGFLSGRVRMDGRLPEALKSEPRTFENPFQTLPLRTFPQSTLRALDHLRVKQKLLVEQFEQGLLLPTMEFTGFAQKWGIVCVQGLKLPTEFQVLIEFNPTLGRFFLFHRLEEDPARIEKRDYAIMRHFGHFRFAEDLLRNKVVNDTTHLDATFDEVKRAADWAASQLTEYNGRKTSSADFMPEMPVWITPYTPPS